MRLKSEGITWQDVDGQVVVLDLRSSLYLELNSSASRLYVELAGGAEREQLVTLLQTTYGIEHEVAHRDVEAFVQSMRQHDLLTEADDLQQTDAGSHSLG